MNLKLNKLLLDYFMTLYQLLMLCITE